MRSSRTACSASCGFSIVFLCIRKRNGVCFVYYYYYWGSLRLCGMKVGVFLPSPRIVPLCCFCWILPPSSPGVVPLFFFFRPIHPDVLYKTPVCLLPLPLSPPPPPPHTPPTMAAAAAFDLLDKFIPGASDSLTIVNATTAQNTLYPGVDFAALNWLERLWASYYIWVGNPIIATGLMSFVLHEVC